jgi:2-oxo-3-hexenedioate decarboxylase
MAALSPALAQAADRLDRAFLSAQQIPRLTQDDPSFDVANAYAVLAELHARRIARGWKPVGRKIGFTNTTIWARYGVDRPMWSHVWDQTVAFAQDGRAELALEGLMEPRIEPEVVFGLAGPLPPGDDPVEILRAVAWFAPGFEIVQSPFPGWKFGAADCAAAYGLHGRLAVGTRVPVTDANREALAAALPAFEVTLARAGAVIERGVGANVLGSPVRALMHLRDLLATQAWALPLAGGEIVTTGTITDAQPVRAGERWSSDYGGLGIPGLTVDLR